MSKLVIQAKSDDELSSEQLWRLKQMMPGIEAIMKAKGGKRGNIQGLTRHLVNLYGGDPHFHTKCMNDPELKKDYDEERRAAICARAHYIATGMWPGEHGGKNPSGPEKKKEESMDKRISRIRTLLSDALNPSNRAEVQAVQSSLPYCYIEGIYPTFIVYEKKGEYFKVDYTIDPETEAVTLGEAVEVEQGWIAKDDEGKPIIIDTEENDDWMKTLPGYQDELEIHAELAAKYAAQANGKLAIHAKK